MKTIEKESMVKRMREIRDQLNEKFEGMEYQQEKTYIKRELKKLKRKRQVTRASHNRAKK